MKLKTKVNIQFSQKLRADADGYRSIQIECAFYLSVSHISVPFFKQVYSSFGLTLFSSQYSIFDSLSIFDLVENTRGPDIYYLLNDFTFRNSMAPKTSARSENFNYLGYVNKCTMQPIPKRDKRSKHRIR